MKVPENCQLFQVIGDKNPKHMRQHTIYKPQISRKFSTEYELGEKFI